MERLQKVLAHAGVASRREAERIIQEGRVTVDGEVVTELGTKVDTTVNRVEVDGVSIRPEQKAYFLFHKPRGVLCTNAPVAGKRRVIDFFAGRRERLYPVGRLDAESEGLIIVTNDGELANRVAHPRYGVPKTYRVLVKSKVEDDHLARLRSGIYLSEGRTSPARVRLSHRSNTETVLELSLHEGRHHEVRRMLATLGFRVSRLRRVAIGGVSDPKLRAGEWRPLTVREIEKLQMAMQSEERVKAPTRRKLL